MATSTAYSTQEAGARFPAIIQEVCNGETVIVADQGQPSVEIRLIQTYSAQMREKLADMEREGVLRTTIRNRQRKIRKPIPGALERFLADRNE